MNYLILLLLLLTSCGKQESPKKEQPKQDNKVILLPTENIQGTHYPDPVLHYEISSGKESTQIVWWTQPDDQHLPWNVHYVFEWKTGMNNDWIPNWSQWRMITNQIEDGQWKVTAYITPELDKLFFRLRLEII